MVCVMQGIRLMIIVGSTKSQYLSVICLDLSCCEWQQLLFLRALGVEEEVLAEKLAHFIYYS